MRTAFCKRSVLVVLAALVALSACDRPPRSAFLPRGGPDSLLDVSSEVVNLSIAQSSERNDLQRWIAKDHPTRAELYCVPNDLGCISAQKMLDKQGIPTTIVPSGNNTVTLVYERILAHDCNARYLDPEDFYNANHPAFGCATAANIVQQVSNKQDFVNPRLLDNPSSVAGVSAYQRAITPKTQSKSGYSVNDSLVKSSGNN